MLLHNTIIAVEEAVATSVDSTIGFSEFSNNLISDSFDAIVASVIRRQESLIELQNTLQLTPEEYAIKNISSEQIGLYLLSNENSTFEEASLALAEQQLELLKAYASAPIPRLKIDNGSVSTKLVYKFSQTENAGLPGGGVVPKLNVRPSSNRKVCSEGSVSGEIIINFKVEEDITFKF